MVMITSHKNNVYFFLAGSKALQDIRDMYRNEIGILQTEWKDKDLYIYGYTYENFDPVVVIGGQQYEYDEFIRNCADVTFFILDGGIGGITKEEFDVAFKSFEQSGRPKIYVFSKKNDEKNEKVEEVRRKLGQDRQYWIEYEDNKELRLLLRSIILKNVHSFYEKIVDEQRVSEWGKIKKWLKKRRVFFITASILLVLSIIVFLITSKPSNNAPIPKQKDFVTQLYLMNYATINPYFDDVYNDSLLMGFLYEDSIDNKDSLTHIFPMSRFLSFKQPETYSIHDYDKDENDVLITSPVDSIPFHFPIIGLKIISNVDSQKCFTSAYLEVMEFHADGTPVCRFSLNNGRLNITNETQMNLNSTIDYSILSDAESFVDYKNHDRFILKNEYEINDIKGSIKALWNADYIIDSKEKMGKWYIPSIKQKLGVPIVSINEKQSEYKIGDVCYFKDGKLRTSQFNRKLAPYEHDTDIFFALKCDVSCEVKVRLKLIAQKQSSKIDKGKSEDDEYLYSEPIYIKIFVPRTGIENPQD